jgi:hypothetical protein
VIRVVLVVVAVCVVSCYVTWTAGRLDRLVSRTQAAWGALDAALVRRAVLAAELAAHSRRHGLLPEPVAKEMEDAALAAQGSTEAERAACENELTRAVRTALASVREADSKSARLMSDLVAASSRLGLARQFFNDAVRDHRAQRRRLLPRLLAHGKPAPAGYFDIEDPTLSEPAPSAAGPT